MEGPFSGGGAALRLGVVGRGDWAAAPGGRGGINENVRFDCLRSPVFGEDGVACCWGVENTRAHGDDALVAPRGDAAAGAS